MAGNGTVYQKDGGNVWWVSYNFRGRRYRESSGSHLKRDAIALLRKRTAEMASGRLSGPRAERVTMEDLRKAVIADYQVNGRKSLGRAVIAMDRLQQFFDGRWKKQRPVWATKAVDITTDWVKEYIVHRQGADAAPATIQRELATLRRMFTLAAQSGSVTAPPYIPALRISNAREGFFDDHEITKVIDNIPEYLRPVVQFAALTGWRKGEILGLTWTNVDFTSSIVRLEPGTTKNDEGREFPFGDYPDLGVLLRERWDARKVGDSITPHVFHHDGQAIKSFRKAWASATKAAGVPGALFHDLRRTAVRNLEAAGVSRSVAMKLTGHKTESVYRRYAIADRASLREGVAKLARSRFGHDSGLDTKGGNR